MLTLLSRLISRLLLSNLRKPGGEMITRASVGYDDERTVRPIIQTCPTIYPNTKRKQASCVLNEPLARFADNPHIATPSKRDLEPSSTSPHTTFPVPLPPYL